MAEPTTIGEELTLTELTAAAKELDPEAHRGLGRERLLEILNEVVVAGRSPKLPQRRINKRRLEIMTYINTHWEAVSATLTCPASSRDPHSCFGCTDLQTTCCVLENQKLFSGDNK